MAEAGQGSPEQQRSPPLMQQQSLEQLLLGTRKMVEDMGQYIQQLSARVEGLERQLAMVLTATSIPPSMAPPGLGLPFAPAQLPPTAATNNSNPNNNAALPAGYVYWANAGLSAKNSSQLTTPQLTQQQAPPSPVGPAKPLQSATNGALNNNNSNTNAAPGSPPSGRVSGIPGSGAVTASATSAALGATNTSSNGGGSGTTPCLPAHSSPPQFLAGLHGGKAQLLPNVVAGSGTGGGAADEVSAAATRQLEDDFHRMGLAYGMHGPPQQILSPPQQPQQQQMQQQQQSALMLPPSMTGVPPGGKSYYGPGQLSHHPSREDALLAMLGPQPTPNMTPTNYSPVFPTTPTSNLMDAINVGLAFNNGHFTGLTPAQQQAQQQQAQQQQQQQQAAALQAGLLPPGATMLPAGGGFANMYAQQQLLQQQHAMYDGTLSLMNLAGGGAAGGHMLATSGNGAGSPVATGAGLVPPGTLNGLTGPMSANNNNSNSNNNGNNASTVVSLDPSRASNEMLDRVCQQPWLKEVHLKGCKTISNFSPLARLRNLWKLNLQGCSQYVDDNVVRLIATYNKRVSRLNLCGCERIVDASALSQLFYLFDLNLSGCSIGNATLEAISKGCSQLSRLAINSCPEVTDVACLGNLKELKLLYCRYSANINPASIAQVLNSIGTTLLTLNIDGVKFTQIDLTHLPPAVALKNLNVKDNTDMTNLFWLTGLPNFAATFASLEMFDADGCKSLCALGDLASLPALKTVRLSHTAITQTELAKLSTSTSITNLYIDGCERITNVECLAMTPTLTKLVVDHSLCMGNPMLNGIAVLRMNGHVEIVFAAQSQIMGDGTGIGSGAFGGISGGGNMGGGHLAGLHANVGNHNNGNSSFHASNDGGISIIHGSSTALLGLLTPSASPTTAAVPQLPSRLPTKTPQGASSNGNDLAITSK